MKSRLVKILGITLLTCMLGGCTATTQTNPMETAETVAETAADTVVTAKTRTKDIAVLYTGDVHCAINENIGYAGLAAYKNQLSADGSEVILVDSGDAIQGAMIGSYSQGESIIKLMNEIGYSALNLGNHEFDYGGIQRVEELSKIATFPFLSLNFIEIETGKPVFNPYTIVESDGVKIAFIGVSTPKTITSSTPTYFMDQNNNFLYDFMRDESGETLWEGIQNTIDEVRREGADYIVALSHLGISDPVFSSCNMIANTTGIDAVLDGHSHSVIECERVKNSEGNRILLTATGTKLEHIGMLLIDRNGNLSTGLISDITEKDSKIEATITELETEYQEEMSKVAAHLKSDLVVNNPITDERIVRNAETNLGDLCADAYRTA